jgi:WD repeat-containing protein 48
MSATTGTPTPRPRQTIETPTVFKANVSKEVDYFSMKPKRMSGAPSTPDDFSGWSGPASKPKDLDTSVQNVPNTPSSGGFMGRLRQLGKSSKRPSAEDAMGMANPATTHKTDQTKEPKVSPS